MLEKKLVKTFDNKVIHLELNNGLESYTKYRNYCYFSNVVSMETKSGENYTTPYDFVHIDLTYELPKYNDKEKYVYYLQTLDGKKYIDNIKIIEVNMDLIKDDCYNNDNKYLAMLDLKPEELANFEGDELIMKYKEELDSINADEKMYKYMSDEKAYQMEINSIRNVGINEGIKEGELSAKKEMIKSMYENEISIENIAKIAKLSINEVTEIINTKDI